MLHPLKRHSGFGLVEVLVTLGVLSVGIVGVTTLHSAITRQSQENKSRAEAVAIAQSRIEEMRNYTGGISSLQEFNTLFADTGGFTNSTDVAGTNASFARAEHVGSSGALKSLTVRVTWTSPNNDTQIVSLHTNLAYIDPGSLGATAVEATASVLDTPMSRARLGKGELPDHVRTTSNGDGTSLYRDDGPDLMLVSDGRIVLTLSEACQAGNGPCIDFARIKGRVWIDQASQDNLNPGEVYVVASDAGFCARHYESNGTTLPVTSTTTHTASTATASYEYFDYTCYIGGGWHGNIGILLARGLSSSDKICMGDATPVIASRRVYRGMLYKYDGSTDSGKEEFDDGNGGRSIRYYSHGIADGVELPAPNSGQTTHDFVIGAFQQNLIEGSHCISQGIMVRADANVSGTTGALFANMPADFICLNEGYIDDYDTTVYGNESTCPHRPYGDER